MCELLLNTRIAAECRHRDAEGVMSTGRQPSGKNAGVLECRGVDCLLTVDDRRNQDITPAGELDEETLLSGLVGLEAVILSGNVAGRDTLVADTTHLRGLDALNCPVGVFPY